MKADLPAQASSASAPCADAGVPAADALSVSDGEDSMPSDPDEFEKYWRAALGEDGGKPLPRGAPEKGRDGYSRRQRNALIQLQAEWMGGKARKGPPRQKKKRLTKKDKPAVGVAAPLPSPAQLLGEKYPSQSTPYLDFLKRQELLEDVRGHVEAQEAQCAKEAQREFRLFQKRQNYYQNREARLEEKAAKYHLEKAQQAADKWLRRDQSALTRAEGSHKGKTQRVHGLYFLELPRSLIDKAAARLPKEDV
jgi:hypothetical protein